MPCRLTLLPSLWGGRAWRAADDRGRIDQAVRRPSPAERHHSGAHTRSESIELIMEQLLLKDTERPGREKQTRATIDWRAVERDYRSGVFSLRALAAKHGCSHSAIANFAGAHGWSREPA